MAAGLRQLADRQHEANHSCRIADMAASHSYPPVRIFSEQWESALSITTHGQARAERRIWRGMASQLVGHPMQPDPTMGKVHSVLRWLEATD